MSVIRTPEEVRLHQRVRELEAEVRMLRDGADRPKHSVFNEPLLTSVASVEGKFHSMLDDYHVMAVTKSLPSEGWMRSLRLEYRMSNTLCMLRDPDAVLASLHERFVRTLADAGKP